MSFFLLFLVTIIFTLSVRRRIISKLQLAAFVGIVCSITVQLAHLFYFGFLDPFFLIALLVGWFISTGISWVCISIIRRFDQQ